MHRALQLISQELERENNTLKEQLDLSHTRCDRLQKQVEKMTRDVGTKVIPSQMPPYRTKCMHAHQANMHTPRTALDVAVFTPSVRTPQEELHAAELARCEFDQCQLVSMPA